MSTTEQTSRENPTEVRVAVAPATFPRVLHAEWIKLWSLRSTYWTVFATIGAMMAIALLMGAAALVAPEARGAHPTARVRSDWATHSPKSSWLSWELWPLRANTQRE